MIQQLAVLNEEKELLKGSHQCNRHNFQDFEKFLCVQRFELFRGHPTREIPKDFLEYITINFDKIHTKEKFFKWPHIQSTLTQFSI